MKVGALTLIAAFSGLGAGWVRGAAPAVVAGPSAAFRSVGSPFSSKPKLVARVKWAVGAAARVGLRAIVNVQHYAGVASEPGAHKLGPPARIAAASLRPSRRNLIVAFHSYDPYDFARQGVPWGSRQEKIGLYRRESANSCRLSAAAKD